MTSSIPRTDAPVRGIVLVIFGGFCFVVMNALVKYLSADYPAPEIVWARYVFHVLFILVLFPHRIPTLLASQRKGLQVLRSVLVFLATFSMFVAVSFLPLADVVAVSFLAPLLVTALSVLILKEKVGPRRWTAVAVGLAAVLIILKPGAGLAHWAVLLPLGMAVFYSLYQIVTRMISASEDPLNSLFYMALVGTLVASAALPFFWVSPTWEAWAMLAGTGFFGGLGHFAIIKALERASLSVVAPYAYLDLVWAAAIGFAVFGDIPDAWTLTGAAIIVLSGLYVLHRERARAG